MARFLVDRFGPVTDRLRPVRTDAVANSSATPIIYVALAFGARLPRLLPSRLGRRKPPWADLGWSVGRIYSSNGQTRNAEARGKALSCIGGERPSVRHRAARRCSTRSGDRMPSPAVPLHCMLWRSLPPFSRGPCARSLRRRRVSRTLAAPREIHNARPPQPSRNKPSGAGPSPAASGPLDTPATPYRWLRSPADALSRRAGGN